MDHFDNMEVVVQQVEQMLVDMLLLGEFVVGNQQDVEAGMHQIVVGIDQDYMELDYNSY